MSFVYRLFADFLQTFYRLLSNLTDFVYEGSDFVMLEISFLLHQFSFNLVNVQESYEVSMSHSFADFLQTFYRLSTDFLQTFVKHGQTFFRKHNTLSRLH